MDFLTPQNSEWDVKVARLRCGFLAIGQNRSLAISDSISLCFSTSKIELYHICSDLITFPSNLTGPHALTRCIGADPFRSLDLASHSRFARPHQVIGLARPAEGIRRLPSYFLGPRDQVTMRKHQAGWV